VCHSICIHIDICWIFKWLKCGKKYFAGINGNGYRYRIKHGVTNVERKNILDRDKLSVRLFPTFPGVKSVAKVFGSLLLIFGGMAMYGFPIYAGIAGAGHFIGKGYIGIGILYLGLLWYCSALLFQILMSQMDRVFPIIVTHPLGQLRVRFYPKPWIWNWKRVWEYTCSALWTILMLTVILGFFIGFMITFIIYAWWIMGLYVAGAVYIVYLYLQVSDYIDSKMTFGYGDEE